MLPLTKQRAVYLPHRVIGIQIARNSEKLAPYSQLWILSLKNFSFSLITAKNEHTMKQRESFVWFLGQAAPTSHLINRFPWGWGWRFPFDCWPWACAHSQAHVSYWPWSMGMTFSSPQWTEEGMMKVPTDHILPAEPPRDRNLWRSWKLSLSCVLRTYVGSLSPPLSLLPKQGGSSLLTHCPDHPPSAPGGSCSLRGWAEDWGMLFLLSSQYQCPSAWFPAVTSHHWLVLGDCTLWPRPSVTGFIIPQSSTPSVGFLPRFPSPPNDLPLCTRSLRWLQFLPGNPGFPVNWDPVAGFDMAHPLGWFVPVLVELQTPALLLAFAHLLTQLVPSVNGKSVLASCSDPSLSSSWLSPDPAPLHLTSRKSSCLYFQSTSRI